MPQLNHVTADVARQLLLSQQQAAPKLQPNDLGMLVSFSQILGGLITPSQMGPVQMTDASQTEEPRMDVREKTEIESRSEPVRNHVRSEEPQLRQPTEELSEGPERQAVSEPVETLQAQTPEASKASTEPVLLKDGQIETLATDDGTAGVLQVSESTKMVAPVEGFGSNPQIFEPELGATADLVEPRAAEPVMEPKSEMVDFLSERTLGLKEAPVAARPLPEEALQKVMPEGTGKGLSEPGTGTLPEFRPLVAEEAPEAGARSATDSPLLTEAQPRTAASSGTALLEEATLQLQQARAQNAAPAPLSSLMSQVVARVEVPAVESTASPVAATAASKAEGVPGVRSAIAAEGSPTLRNEAQRVNQAEIIERIVRMTKAGVNRGKQEVRLVLNPPELGGMKIHLKIENGTLEATIRTDTMNAHQLVNANLTELRQALTEAGLDVGFLEVLLTDGEAKSGENSTFEDQLNQHRAGADAQKQGYINAEPELAAAAAYSTSGMSLIDIRV
jgi:flagellar hook-length control protein FliK